MHRFAAKSPAPQADGLGTDGLAASHPGRGESCLWRVPVTVQSRGSIWYLRRWPRIFLQDRLNLHHPRVSLVGTLALVPTAWVPTPWSWLLEPYLIPNLTHSKRSVEDQSLPLTLRGLPSRSPLAGAPCCRSETTARRPTSNVFPNFEIPSLSSHS